MTAPARELWQRLETLHAVTYFAPESVHAARDAGLRGFWMGYFGVRAAPMGAVSAGIVTATFANFAPAMVERAIPDAWSFARPATLVDVRARSAATALRRLVTDIEPIAIAVNPLLGRILEDGDISGRPLFAANVGLDTSDDPVERLWHLATCVREHRGDGHLHVLSLADVDGCESHVLHAADHATPIETLRDNRGWTVEEWLAATERLAAHGLMAGSVLTEAGRALRRRIESETDRLALGNTADDDLIDALTPAADAVASSGVIPFPNPMGLPSLSTE